MGSEQTSGYWRAFLSTRFIYNIHMQKGVSFVLVLVLTTLVWVILGLVLPLFFPSLSLMVFLLIGLVAGLLLASLLAFMHEDTVPVVAPHPEATDPAASNPPALRPGAGLLNSGSDSHSQACAQTSIPIAGDGATGLPGRSGGTAGAGSQAGSAPQF